MDSRELVRERMESSIDEMISSVGELVSIDSRVTQPEKDSPFGPGVQKAFLYMLEKGENDGFAVFNADNYGGHIELPCGDPSAETLGILVHLDIVPPGEGWSGDPFTMEEKDGKLYGRGVADDKGPAMAAYYAMKAIKDAGVKPDRNIRLILGLDEETEWKGMNYYLEKTEAPDFGFVPDADFPAINGEKGIIVFTLAKKFPKTSAKGLELRSLKGGSAANMVADRARMVVLAENRDLYEPLRAKVEIMKEEGYRIKARGTGKSLEITAEGIPSHGAVPEDGLNAISVLMKFADGIDFTNEGVCEFIRFYNEHIGFELDGESLGIRLSDEKSGNTVVNVGIIDMDGKSVRMDVNVRIPVSYDDEDIYSGMSGILEEYSIGVIKGKYQPSIWIDTEGELIKTLMNVYREETGDADAQPLVIGGGTYARAADNLVAFGIRFPGEEDTCHKADEYIVKESLIKAAFIYADALVRLACSE